LPILLLEAKLNLAISKTGKKKTFTCQNPSCRKTFNTPLKTLNLQQNAQESYFSCPCCLTKIELINSPLKTEEKFEEPVTELKPKSKHVDLYKKDANNCEKPAACQYHLGHLSERTSKTQIPDDCLVCKDIIECMLRKMRE
jgi:hypothetical protein